MIIECAAVKIKCFLDIWKIKKLLHGVKNSETEMFRSFMRFFISEADKSRVTRFEPAAADLRSAVAGGEFEKLRQGRNFGEAASFKSC